MGNAHAREVERLSVRPDLDPKEDGGENTHQGNLPAVVRARFEAENAQKGEQNAHIEVDFDSASSADASGLRDSENPAIKEARKRPLPETPQKGVEKRDENDATSAGNDENGASSAMGFQRPTLAGFLEKKGARTAIGKR
jgi:hypothetical protein